MAGSKIAAPYEWKGVQALSDDDIRKQIQLELISKLEEEIGSLESPTKAGILFILDEHKTKLSDKGTKVENLL